VRQSVFVRSAAGQALADALVQLGQRLRERAVLYPSTDAQLEVLIDHYDSLSEFFHVPVNRAVGHRLFLKSWQYDLARELGVPTAAHVHFRGGESPDVGQLRFPLIVKPVARVEAEGGSAFRLRIVESPESLLPCVEELARAHPGRLFQLAENIPGDSSTLVTVGSYSDRGGKVLASYTGRKLTQWPPTHGSASVAESVSLPGEVVQYAKALLEHGRIHGITQVEFKRDPRDGLYKLIEINGRAWSWIKLATESGINLPLLQYADLAAPNLLDDFVARRQVNDCFFVQDYHVALNRSVAERSLIRNLSRHKRRVLAMWYPGEWRLWIAHRVITAAKVLRERLRVRRDSGKGEFTGYGADLFKGQAAV
jgi:predicted ATP-grasp superfamily ATP-dependent carboligase